MTFTPKIIGLCGYPRSGKDEAAKALVERHNWQRVAFADKLREVALAIDPWVMVGVEHGANQPPVANAQFTGPDGGVIVHGPCKAIPIRLSDVVADDGWDFAKSYPEVRRLLQRIGTEAVRDIIGRDTWVQLAERSMQVGRHVVITDCRFPNEAEMIRSRGGLLIWIERPGCEAPAHNQHSSEAYGFSMDHRITNAGSIADLHNRILEIAGISL